MSNRIVSCVICAYNEASRIGDVLRVVAFHPRLTEVIVVDDGSRDQTSDVARSFQGVRVIVQEKNGGKSRAMVKGVMATRGDLIVLLDADLKGLTRENITALIEPVLSGNADVSISVRGNSLAIYRAIGLDFVSGERVVPRKLISDHAAEIETLPSFGVESFLNRRIIEKNLRIAVVPLPNVINIRKAEKIGRVRGMLSEWKMIFDILRVLSPIEVIRQNYRMLRLSRVRTRSTSDANLLQP